jgi:hypothetical protein
MGISFWILFIIQFALLIMAFVTINKVENERPTSMINPITDQEGSKVQ